MKVPANILAERITSLDSQRFVELVNDLLVQTAASHDIPIACLSLNLKTTEPDGGVDARCRHAPSVAGRLIPGPTVVYQFKSGSGAGSAAAIAKDDILAKPGVKGALQAGLPFVFIAGRDRGEKFETEIVEALKEAGFEVDPELVVYLGPTMLAAMMQDFPAMVIRFYGGQWAYEDFESWSLRESLSNDFVDDHPHISQLVEQLRLQFGQDNSLTRIVGAAGNGKTRCVLEALRAGGPEVTGAVLYTERFESACDLLASLRRIGSSRCIVVVDDVVDHETRQLQDRFPSMPSGVSLIIIGLDAEAPSEAGVIQIPAVRAPVLEEMLRRMVVGLPEPFVQEVAKGCDGSPKLLYVLGKVIARRPQLVHQALLGDDAIQRAIDQFLEIDKATDDYHVIASVALVHRLGWDEQLASESEELFCLMNLDYSRARVLAEKLHSKYGIFPPAGRYRYVSPAILADHLASHMLKSMPPSRLRTLISSAGPAIAEGFSRRLRRLGPTTLHGKLIEEVLLGPDGPYKSLSDIQDGGRAVSLLQTIAAVFPVAVTEALHRIVMSSSLEALQAAVAPRRAIMWALEQVLWLRHTFPKAAEVLHRLALAENENWANNATGIWKETFQTYLGRTEAELPERLLVLRNAMALGGCKSRQLVAEALESALTLNHLSRMGMPPKDVPGYPEAWKPASKGELESAVGSYLELLTVLMADETPEVRLCCVQALRTALEAALLSDELFETYFELCKRLEKAEFRLREPLIERIQDLRFRKSKGITLPPGLTDPRFARLEELEARLVGEEPLERLRALLLRPAWDRMEHGSFSENLAALIQTLIETPKLLEPQLDWIQGAGNYALARAFFQQLGEADGRGKLAGLLLNGETKLMPDLLAAYLRALPDQALRESLISTREDPALMLALLRQEGYSEENYRRLLAVVETGHGEQALSTLTFSDWPQNLSPEQVEELIRRASRAPGTLRFLADYVDTNPASVETLADVALDVLDSVLPVTGDNTYHWVQLASLYAAQQPVRIFRAYLGQPPEVHFSQKEEIEELLQRVWTAAPASKLLREVVEPAIERDGLAGYVAERRLKLVVPQDDDVPSLIQWIGGDRDKRAKVVGSMAGKPGESLSRLQVELLKLYPQEAGGRLWGNLIEGSHFGPASLHWRQKLPMVEVWEKHEVPEVRAWAAGVRAILLSWIRQSEREEAERDFE